ncbi:MAG TPA: BLUF domain-containing protein [Cyclobacteriaceae bacterium]|nr:BLUF domain-containing protein [Cyclobacteriaceae bacterium]
MHYLLYVSYAAKEFSEDELRLLLQQSQNNNKDLHITGMLVLLKGRFIQVLEGERKLIFDLYEKIRKDARHHKVALLLEGEIEKRNFENWSMGFESPDIEEFEKLTGFEDLDAFFSIKHKKAYDHPALVFMQLFYDKNRRDFFEV